MPLSMQADHVPERIIQSRLSREERGCCSPHVYNGKCCITQLLTNYETALKADSDNILVTLDLHGLYECIFKIVLLEN